MEIKLLRSRDRLRLESAFHQAYDASMVEQALQRLEGNGRELKAGLPKGLEEIGEGTHFRAFKFRTAVGQLPAGLPILPLCLKVAKPSFTSKLGRTGMARWAAALEKLTQGDSADLIPPMAVLRVRSEEKSLNEELWAVVMPFGAGDIQSAAPHWQPIGERLREAELWLKKAGYILDDVVQARCWDGVPFLIDFSDLRQL